MSFNWNPSGVIILDKPKGPTSAYLGRELGKKIQTLGLGKIKIGHAGTLDPLATGVLPLCLGEATKISQYLMLEDKTYLAEIELGKTTDTYDIEGKILSEKPVPSDLSQEKIMKVLEAFQGEFLQTPPSFSAKKVQGKSSHYWARKGKEIQLEPQKVKILEIKLLAWENPKIILSIHCSKGTYIRSLAQDLGEKIGCGGILTALQRNQNGRFALDQAITWGEIEKRENPEDFSNFLQKHMISLNDALGHLRSIKIINEQSQYIQSGRDLNVNWIQEILAEHGFESNSNTIKILDPKQNLLALIFPKVQPIPTHHPQWQYLRVFN